MIGCASVGCNDSAYEAWVTCSDAGGVGRPGRVIMRGRDDRGGWDDKGGWRMMEEQWPVGLDWDDGERGVG